MAFIVVFILFFAIQSVYSATTISDCTNITSSGDYVLDSNITYTGSNDCMKINISNVKLDCQNNILNGPSNKYGIYATMSSLSTNLSIVNCVLQGWSTSIYFEELLQNITVENVSVINSSAEGIMFYDVSFINVNNVDVSGSTAESLYFYTGSDNDLTNISISNVTLDSGSGAGITLNDINGMMIVNSTIKNMFEEGINIFGDLINFTISNNNFLNNAYGINYNNNAAADSNNFTNNKIENNSNYGIYFNSGVNNLTNQIFFNNILNNTNNIFIPSNFSLNHFNISLQSGVNIIGGNFIGGNYWDNYTGTNGFSETCTDANKDAICDSSYVINNANSTDYFPLAVFNGSITDCFNITVNDTGGDSMTVYFFGNDTLLSTNTSVSSGTPVTYNWVNLIDAGSYNWSVIVKDNMGNTSFGYNYFTIDLPDDTTTSTTTSGGGGSASLSIEDEEVVEEESEVLETDLGDFSVDGEKSFEMKKNEINTFSIGEELHEAEISEIGTDYVVLVISSEPVSKKILVGETQYYDMNQNEQNELAVTLNSISNGSANLVFEHIEEVVYSYEKTLWNIVIDYIILFGLAVWGTIILLSSLEWFYFVLIGVVIILVACVTYFLIYKHKTGRKSFNFFKKKR